MPSSVRLFAVVLAAPFAVAPSASADPRDRRNGDLSFSDGDPGASEAPSTGEEEAPAEPQPVIVGDFCGGGPDSPLDEVRSLLDENKPAMARAQLGRVLRDGIQEWERPRGFAMAGEIALRIGAPARAVAWYRDALRVSEEPADPTARLGLAVALLRTGRKADAASTVAALLTDECGEDAGGGDPMTCYGARLVAGFAAFTREARAEELARARAIREESPEYDEMFVDFHRLLPTAARAVAGARVASASE